MRLKSSAGGKWAENWAACFLLHGEEYYLGFLFRFTLRLGIWDYVLVNQVCIGGVEFIGGMGVGVVGLEFACKLKGIFRK